MSNPFDDSSAAGSNPFETAVNAQPSPGSFDPAQVFGESLPAPAPAPTTPTATAPQLEFQPPPPAVPEPAPAVPERKKPKAATPPPPEPPSAVLTADSSFNFEAAAASAPTAPGEGAAPSSSAPEAGKATGPRKWFHMFYKVSWYQPYFDIDTSDMLLRMLAGLIPVGKGFFARVGDRPDMYGPVWLTTTLLFLLAIASNFASFIGYWWAGHSDQWEYDFYKVAVGAGVFYGYVAVIPIVLWAVQKWWLKTKLTLVSCWSLYGYTLVAFLLATPVCIAPIEWLRWVAIMLACGVSTACLIIALWPPFKAEIKKAIPVLIVVAALHVALALVYKLYFFSPVKVVLSSSQ